VIAVLDRMALFSNRCEVVNDGSLPASAFVRDQRRHRRLRPGPVMAYRR